jgi:long-chain acyl-CoA synthetase
MLGGRVRLMITGSAPIDGTIISFLKVVFSCPFREGFGQTETSAPATLAKSEDGVSGHVGGPLTCCKARLRDIPEMSYFSTDENPRGELLLKGPSIFEGYFKEPEKTKEAFDEQGWLRTGDVCVAFPNGALKIIDRAKNIFKLCQGEYIAPEKLENIYILSPYIGQIFVYGDSL